MADLKPAAAFIFSRTPITDSSGNPTYAFLKQLQLWQQQLTNGLNAIGQITQDIPPTTPIEGRTEGIGTTVQFIDSGGIVLADGIDFARAYINKNTDHIADGTGSPLSGGKAAEIALVTSPPAVEPHKWVDGLVADVFTKSQPAFSDISGAATASQVPDLDALDGRITVAQLPSAGISVTITTAAITPTGAQGSMTFENGILTAQVPAT